MSFKLIFPAVIAYLIGFGIGCIPFVNEYLHWNIWFIIPISGLLLGVLFGAIEFYLSYFMDVKVEAWGIFLLTAAAVFGYVAIDYGVYTVSTIEITGAQGVPSGTYRIRDLLAFTDYMKWLLGGSVVGTIGGAGSFEMGAAGTTISYIADLIGALLGSAGALLACTDRYPYCPRCKIYKKSAKKYEFIVENESVLSLGILADIKKFIDSGKITDLIDYCETNSIQYTGTGAAKLVIDLRICRKCEDISIVGRVYRFKKGNWDWDTDFNFSADFCTQTTTENLQTSSVT